ncbi:unnamed protein product [[Candida] boidinii]|uniref:Unnamed protein product n=1 Tax=Candida boidinii TaxID=5477 RepID=A0A9W6SZP7_CANBO|nr:unnamed protein product [[Candida] boidinii]
MNVYLGIDVGTASVRLSIVSKSGELIHSFETDISRFQDEKNVLFVTQSSTQIWTGIKTLTKHSISFLNNKYGVGNYNIRSICGSGTCSQVIMQRQYTNGSKDASYFTSFSANLNSDDINQDIIMWMDKRASKQADQLNSIFSGTEYLANYEFMSEMSMPRLKYLYDNLPTDVFKNLVIFELSDYISYMLITNNDSEYIESYRNRLRIGEIRSNIRYSNAKVGVDGTLKGFDKKFYKILNIDVEPNNIGCIENILYNTETEEFPKIPYLGQKMAFANKYLFNELGYRADEETVVSNGTIDCYSGLISASLLSKIDPSETTLAISAGTSSCMMLIEQSDSHNAGKPVGVWGPFNSLVQNCNIYEGGQSSSGYLFNVLFKVHPAIPELMKLYEDNEYQNCNIFEKLDNYIEEQRKTLGLTSCFHLNSRKFFYGDYLGNRTPFNNPNITGSYIGQTDDYSINDLANKYLCIIEFLAFQIKLIVDLFGSERKRIQNIVIFGSQNKNKTLIKLIKILTCKDGFKLKLLNNSKESVSIGSCLLGLICAETESRDAKTEINLNFLKSSDFEFCDYSIQSSDVDDDIKLYNLMMEKYKICNEMVSKQLEYLERIEKFL